MSLGWIGIAVAGALLVWIMVVFNSLIALRTRVQNAWAEIDVQLKRRQDLVPSLVESVRGYMQHERTTLEDVTQARMHALVAGGNVPQRWEAESALAASLGNLMAVTENYPQLRAVENVKILQEQLTSTENRIALARQFYNDQVRQYNTAQLTFPKNLFAKVLGFSPSALFSFDDTKVPAGG